MVTTAVNSQNSASNSTLSPVRVERNIILNAADINEHYGTDAGLVRDLIVYICYNYTHNLFGFNRVSLTDFCKVMGYKKSNLSKRHPAAETRKHKPNINGYEWSSQLEYTIYRMIKENIVFTYKAKVPGMNIEGISSIPVLVDARVLYDSRRPQKRYYELKLSKEFISNLLSYYSTVFLEDYIAAGTQRNKSLFMYLSMLQHVAMYKKEEITPYFDHLCKIADIHYENNREKKRHLQKALREIQERTSLNFEFEFYKGAGQSHAYSIRIVFKEFNKLSPKKEMFKNQLFNKLQDFYFYKYEKQYPNLFQQWLGNNEYDTEIKKEIFAEVYENIYQKRIDMSQAHNVADLNELIASIA